LVYPQARGSVFGAEDDVIENLCVGAHDQIAYKMYVCLSGLFYYLYEPTIMNSLQNFADILQIDAVILNPIRGSSLSDHFNSALRCGAIHVDPHSLISDVPNKYFGQICYGMIIVRFGIGLKSQLTKSPP
jgi:uncharacterized membrane protein